MNNYCFNTIKTNLVKEILETKFKLKIENTFEKNYFFTFYSSE